MDNINFSNWLEIAELAEVINGFVGGSTPPPLPKRATPPPLPGAKNKAGLMVDPEDDFDNQPLNNVLGPNYSQTPPMQLSPQPRQPTAQPSNQSEPTLPFSNKLPQTVDDFGLSGMTFPRSQNGQIDLKQMRTADLMNLYRKLAKHPRGAVIAQKVQNYIMNQRQNGKIQ